MPDSVALVTGAGSGIGAAVTRRFVEEGARVVAFDLAGERLAPLQSELGARIVTYCGDVRSAADNRDAVRLAVDRFGRLDVFIGNAGIWDGKRRLSDLTEDELIAGFDEVFAINVRGYFLGAKAAIPELARSKGCMIFTLSTSSFYMGGGGSIYVAAKHAALGLVRELAHELAPEIRVNGVAPSYTPTALVEAVSLAQPPDRGGPSETPDARATNLLEVDVRPDDHAGAYVFLASKHSRMTTGTVINSDGGRGVMGAPALIRRGRDV